MKEKHQSRILSRGQGGAGTSFGKDKYFNVTCKIESTNEKYPLKNVYNEMKVKDLKLYAEFATGIPANLQRFCYLDEGDLLDHTDLKQNDIVSGALLHLKIWHTWSNLVEAAATNDIDWVFHLGVSADSDFKSPNSDYMGFINPRLRKQWLEERAFVALFIASHRGHRRLVEKLIESGANVNAKTPYGRSPLHVAAARGHGNIVDTLLEKGADIDAADKEGDTPLSVATKFGNKVCERHLFLFRWQQRAKQTLKNKIQVEMFAHQYFDSTNPVWLKGPHGQVYYTQIMPPSEYEGTSLGAPRRQLCCGSSPDPYSDRCQSYADSDTVSEEDEEVYSKGDAVKRRQRLPDVMPAIKEENSSTREKSSSVAKSSKSAGDVREKSKSYAFARRHISKNAKSFDEWLKMKQHSEYMKVQAKKQEEMKKQMVDDDSYQNYYMY